MLIIWKEVSWSIGGPKQHNTVLKDTCDRTSSSSSLVEIPKEHKTDL